MSWEILLACDTNFMFFSVKNVLIKVGQMKGLVQVDMEFVVYVSSTFTNFIRLLKIFTNFKIVKINSFCNSYIGMWRNF